MNQANIENNRFITISLLILALVAVAFALNFTKPIMIPFVLALLIRILIDPIIDFQIQNLRIHRIIAVFISLILIIFLFIIIVPLIVSSVATFLQSADDYNSKVLILIDILINKLRDFDIVVDRDMIRKTLLDLPFLDLDFFGEGLSLAPIFTRSSYQDDLKNQPSLREFHHPEFVSLPIR